MENQNWIYVDNNATTRVAPEVLEAMQPYFCDLYGNPSSLHPFGAQIRRAVENAREQVAAFLSVRADEILFTSCGTESNNLAIRGVLNVFPNRKHLITSRVEHSSVLRLCEALQREGFEVTFLEVDARGLPDLDQLRRSIRPDTALISIMWANNETGVILPIEEIGALARERKVLFHTDAVQAAGKVPLNLESLPVDLLTLSGHKLYAPKGIAALYLRRGRRLRPLLEGGHQEKGLRSGTENVASIIGLGRACQLAEQWREEDIARIGRLRDHFETSVQNRIQGVQVHGKNAPRIPNTSFISFEAVEGEALLVLLGEKGICASSGSACSSGSTEPSQVLRAMGISDSIARGAVRFSLGRYNLDEDLEQILSVLPVLVEKLRALSPHYSKGK